MATRRERLAARVERRREWADGHAAKAAALIKQDAHYRGDHAFNTQPGHIPERARANRRAERAWEHTKAAEHHAYKANALASALDRQIFSDDSDAPERLRERIEELSAKRDRIKAYNRSCAARSRAGKMGDSTLLSEAERRDILSLAQVCAYQVRPGGGFPAYVLSNLGANIRRLQERLTEVARQTETREAAASSARGVVITDPGNGYISVTFEEKPARAILAALRAAGFRWGGGSWYGPAADVPSEVAALAEVRTPGPREPARDEEPTREECRQQEREKCRAKREVLEAEIDAAQAAYRADPSGGMRLSRAAFHSISDSKRSKRGDSSHPSCLIYDRGTRSVPVTLI